MVGVLRNVAMVWGVTALVVLAVMPCGAAASSPKGAAGSSSGSSPKPTTEENPSGEVTSASRNTHMPLNFASPLESFTIMDAPTPPSPRTQFLQRFKVGFQAETKARALLKRRSMEEQEEDDESVYQSGWDAKQTEAMLQQKKRQQDLLVEKAYDLSTSAYDRNKQFQKTSKPTIDSRYQFVGVVDPSSKKTQAVTWYARKKPKNAKWSIRLMHVNRQAIVKDLFQRGKVDVFGQYVNTGQVDEETGRPVVKAQYAVREKSWRTLWNFNPKHFFTDSSGMYWRERRLSSGLYTDGSIVYETSYRYTDGKNGMKRVAPLKVMMESKAWDAKTKATLSKRLKEASPDIVIEK
eukprot:scaffold85663_cov45-Attheya_sp.AAC.5